MPVARRRVDLVPVFGYFSFNPTRRGGVFAESSPPGRVKQLNQHAGEPPDCECKESEARRADTLANVPALRA
jgi:hypothetical protein